MYQQHQDPEVQRAIIRLCDALCSWERATGRQSMVVIVEVGFEFVANDGKPIPDDSRIGMKPSDFLASLEA
jgi:hypothetical protein